LSLTIQQNLNSHSAGGETGFAGLGFVADFWFFIGTSSHWPKGVTPSNRLESRVKKCYFHSFEM
jgi:hypothetical protein